MWKTFTDEAQRDYGIVSTTEREKLGRAPFAIPIVAFALLISAHFSDWPDEERVREISDSILYEP